VKGLPFLTRAALLRIGFAVFATVTAGFVAWWHLFRMPGHSFDGELPPPDGDATNLAREMEGDVRVLAGEIGERNLERYGELQKARDFIATALNEAGYQVERQSYEMDGRIYENLIAELHGVGKQDEIVVVGAHYDTVPGSPGANDNGSGVAALLAIARRFAGSAPGRTLRLVAFVNEEPFHFKSSQMGSHVYAKRCKERGEKIVAMLSLETIGYYCDAPGSQAFPIPGLSAIYPDTGNFIAFVGNLGSAELVRKAVGTFRKHAEFPSEGAALPEAVPGAGWSDHWSFWQMGYPAIMVTDTAPFRYPHYHSAEDTPDKIDYERMARVVGGLLPVIRELI
jgi:hypothetical protein